MKTSFNEDLKFGVEIEVKASSEINDVINEIKTNGVDCIWESYNHVTKRNWKVVTDSSCGFEFVSPILVGKDGLRQIKVVTDALNKYNIKVDKSCGLHVHINADDMTFKQIRNVYALYVRFEKTIDSMMPKSRRGNGNRFCQSMLMNRMGVVNAEQIMDLIKSAKNVNDIRHIYETRYKKLNCESYFKYGTIEFRQHSGTTEYEKIYNWILFINAFVQKAKESNVKLTYSEKGDDFTAMIKALNMIKAKGATEEIESCVRFYRKRIKALKGGD